MKQKSKTKSERAGGIAQDKGPGFNRQYFREREKRGSEKGRQEGKNGGKGEEKEEGQTAITLIALTAHLNLGD